MNWPLFFKDKNNIQRGFVTDVGNGIAYLGCERPHWRLPLVSENKQLYIVSNNKADQNYINIGCGIKSLYIPSICLYTNEKYTGNINQLLIYNMENLFPQSIS